MYAHALLATIVFGGIGIPAAHENSPGMRRGYISRWGVLRNDRCPFSGVRDKKVQVPRFRARRGPFCQCFYGPICPLCAPALGVWFLPGINSAPRTVVDTSGALPTVPHGNPIPISGV